MKGTARSGGGDSRIEVCTDVERRSKDDRVRLDVVRLSADDRRGRGQGKGSECRGNGFREGRDGRGGDCLLLSQVVDLLA